MKRYLSFVAVAIVALTVGFLAGAAYQRAVALELLEDLKVPGPMRTGNRMLDGLAQFAYDQGCAAYTSGVLTEAQEELRR